MRKVALLLSLSGTTSLTEKGLYHAALYALDEFNKKATSRNELVEFVVRDIRSDPEETARQAEELAKEGINIFVGTYTSACRKAVLPILEKYNGLLVYPALYEGHETHKHVLYTGEVPNQQVYTTLKFMTEHFGPNIYLIGNDYIYPRETNKQVAKYLKELKGKVVGERYVPFGYSSFIEEFQTITSQKPDAIFSTLVGESLVPFYRTFHQLGYNPAHLPIFSPTTKETEVLAIGKEYVVGHYSCGSYFQTLDIPENIEFVEKFQHHFGYDSAISSVMFNTYLGVKLLLEEMIKINSSSYLDILHSLSEKTFASPCGPIKVEKNNQHLTRPVRIGCVNSKGQFTIVWDSKTTIAASPFYTNNLKTSEVDQIDWKEAFQEWAAASDEVVIMVNRDQEVIYANYMARSTLHMETGHRCTKEHLEAYEMNFTIKEEYVDPLKFNKMIILKKKSNVIKGSIYEGKVKTFHIIKTKNASFQNELKVAEVAAASDANVLIFGETGSGKEVIAQAIHQESKRKNEPFIAINAGAIPRELIGSELFGFVEGAFTGAKKGGKVGKFEAAHKGTLFLDEIGEMPLDLQVSLLRVLETRKLTRIGDNKERQIDVRIIAATNRNLKEEIAFQGSFRSDLYYRLNVMSITIPPLRERKEDIEELTYDFLAHFHAHYQTGPLKTTPATLEALQFYSWPGNIRELRNTIERAFLLAKGEKKIDVEHLPIELYHHAEKIERKVNNTIQWNEKQLIERALQTTDNLTEVARKLGISRSTLYRKIKTYAISQ